MNDSPEVSVVMSVYNGADHLRQTMDSILAQEGVSFEVVIVNDGSTDQSAKILGEYANRDERVRVFQQENQGLTRSLIKGCSEAQGKYIARHDVGDISDPKRLLLQKSTLDETRDLVFVSSWTEFCGPQWEHLYVFKGTGQAALPVDIISEPEENGTIDGPTSHPSVMFRKDFYGMAGGYRSEFYYGQDWDLWYRLAELGKFQTIERILYKARILPDSITMKQTARQKAISALSVKALRRRARGLSEEPVLTEAKLIRPKQPKIHEGNAGAAGLYFIGECLRRNGDHRALAYFKKAISNSPFLIKAWVRILQHKVSPNKKRIPTALSVE